MRTLLIPLTLVLVACGPSEVEVTEAQRAEAEVSGDAKAAGEGPVDLGEGLVLTVLARGTGEFVRAGGKVRVHYTADVVAVAPPPEGGDEDEDESAGDDEPDESGDGEEPVEEPEQGGDDDQEEPEEQPEEDAPADDEPAADELPRRFDSSRARGVPDVWDLSRTAQPRLIEGLRRGLVGLTAGSRVTLHIPAALAWGDAGLPSVGVPARADVSYEIEVLEVLP